MSHQLFPLQHPLQYNGKEVAAVTVRAVPRAKDLRVIVRHQAVLDTLQASAREAEEARAKALAAGSATPPEAAVMIDEAAVNAFIELVAAATDLPAAAVEEMAQVDLIAVLNEAISRGFFGKPATSA